MDDPTDIFTAQSRQRSVLHLPEEADRGGGVARAALLAVILIAALALAHFLPIRSWMQDSVQDRRILLERAGVWIYPASTAAIAILVAVGVPRLLLCGLAGMVLGFWWGLGIVQVATLLGNYGVFLFVRGWGRDWALRRWPALRKWAEIVQDHGVGGVVLLRALPIHGTVVNLGLGLSHVKSRHFLLGTLIGSFPEAIPATLAGAGLVRKSLAATASYLAIAALAMSIIWIVCGYVIRRLRQTRSGSEVLVEAASLKD